LLLISAHLDDLPDLLFIESSSFVQPWSKGDFLSELGKSLPSIFVARGDLESPVLGYICFWEVADEIQMLNLAVHPEYRRQGVGRTLLTFLLKQAQEKKATKVFLEVRPSNQAALALYRSLGFKALYRRPNYYPPEGEEALVMGWSV
jgi:ribosomal-protein-alanine N-acetyltransferase